MEPKNWQRWHSTIRHLRGQQLGQMQPPPGPALLHADHQQKQSPVRGEDTSWPADEWRYDFCHSPWENLTLDNGQNFQNGQKHLAIQAVMQNGIQQCNLHPGQETSLHGAVQVVTQDGAQHHKPHPIQERMTAVAAAGKGLELRHSCIDSLDQECSLHSQYRS